MREAKTLTLTFFLELRKGSAFFKEVFVGALQVFQNLLQCLRWRFLEPLKFLLPVGELIGQRHVVHKLCARRVAGLLQCQRLVEHEAADPGEAAHAALLSAVRHEFVFKGLEALHGGIL